MAYLGGAVGTIFKPLVKTQVPELSTCTCRGSLLPQPAIVSIKKRYPNHAYNHACAVGLGQLMFSKVIIGWMTMSTCTTPAKSSGRTTKQHRPDARRVQIVKGPVDSLNHPAMVGYGSKMDSTPRANGRPKATPAMARRGQNGPLRPWPNRFHWNQWARSQPIQPIAWPHRRADATMTGCRAWPDTL